MSRAAGGGQSWVVGKLAFCAESAGVHAKPLLGPPWHVLLGGVRPLARLRPRRVHHLQLAELLDPPLAVLAAEPAPLDAAEGDLGAHVHVLVDPGRTALEALGDLLAARDVVGPHRAAEAVVRAVRLRERFVEVAVGDDGEARAELLLVDPPHAIA